ncbi:hypothetical protein LTR70_000334 [Exophiala xenobiotica]|uniref:Protein kinase domain-containing protein n=1 Tax=Lithohypha guttulata TaxID=1690604 RepID=A0ABR0KPJ0_9EURO|nr:hypothetical protein LTR24_000037 [Lithohypha guttulata]KAK5330504.1 hypothetical protein LTR70_000334 [Exophiala xenobiotica]
MKVLHLAKCYRLSMLKLGLLHVKRMCEFAYLLKVDNHPMQRLVKEVYRRTAKLSSSLFSKPPYITTELLEEERLSFYKRKEYYPIHIGDTHQSREGNYKALKASTALDGRPDATRREAKIYKHLSLIKSDHPGQANIRGLYDTFELQSSAGAHQCLLQPAMHMTLMDLLRMHDEPFGLDLLKMTLGRLLRALDFLHTEAQVVHLDLKPDNIMISIEDDTMLERFAKAESKHPTPRKIVDDTLTIYTRRPLPTPKDDRYGVSVLCDFGEARIGETHKTGPLVQPHNSRAPEVIFEIPWGPPVDIWNVRCLAWALFEGRYLFQNVRTNNGKWEPYVHVAQIVSLLGQPPVDFLRRSNTASECFDNSGTWIHDDPRVSSVTLEDLEVRLEEPEKGAFLKFIRSMLTWLPEERKTARELLEDPWLQE